MLAVGLLLAVALLQLDLVATSAGQRVGPLQHPTVDFHLHHHQLPCLIGQLLRQGLRIARMEECLPVFVP